MTGTCRSASGRVKAGDKKKAAGARMGRGESEAKVTSLIGMEGRAAGGVLQTSGGTKAECRRPRSLCLDRGGLEETLVI